MHTDGQSRHVEDQHKPTVSVWLVGVIFPLEDKPEHHGGEGGRVSIDLTLDGGEPEGVRPGVDERAHHTGGLDGNHLGNGQLAPVLDDELAHQMRDGPEKE